ncbi:MAG TPA: uroporphyrinogen decarboxylase family protein [Vicinamibacterales bacterium]
MTKREVVTLVLDGKRPPYVPWSFGFTVGAKTKLQQHFGTADLEEVLQNHLLKLGSDLGFFEDVGQDRRRDVFGVVWDRSVDKDIGTPEGCVLPAPTLRGYDFPDPLDPRVFADIPGRIAQYGDRFRVFQIGFSLFERAWTLRGMTNLLMDLHLNPAFVHELLGAITEYNIAQIREACRYDIDAIYFGDDWGQQRGLLMGPVLWRKFLKPHLARMYAEAHRAGKYVFIHSCGDVDELFDDLFEIGLNCFNPFQPEVMDTTALLARYRGRLTFHGGLSIQRTLPFGTAEEVRRETRRLLELGGEGNYILAPSHDVPKDVSLENMLAVIGVAQQQLSA